MPTAGEQQIGEHAREQQRSRRATISERCRCSTEPDNRACDSKEISRAAPRRPTAKVKRAEGDDRGDLFRGQAQCRVRPVANGAAAQRIQADVVADRVAHEGDQGEPRIGHPRAGEAQAQCVVKRQAAVAQPRQQHRAQQAARLEWPACARGCPASGTGRGRDAARTTPARTGRSRAASSMRGTLRTVCGVRVSRRVSYQGAPDAGAVACPLRTCPLRPQKLLGLGPQALYTKVTRT